MNDVSKQKLQEVVAPFLKEWKALSKPNNYTLEFSIHQDGKDSSVIVGNIKVNVVFTWESNDSASISGLEAKRTKKFLCEDYDFLETLVCLSKEYKDFNNRISEFCKQTEAAGKLHFKDKDYLWLNYFWNE